MTTAFAHTTPIPAFGTAREERMPLVQARIGPSRNQWVDALVTMAVMAWFAVALAAMNGEFHGVPAAPAAQPASASDRPSALPRTSARPGNSAGAGISLI